MSGMRDAWASLMNLEWEITRELSAFGALGTGSDKPNPSRPWTIAEGAEPIGQLGRELEDLLRETETNQNDTSYVMDTAVLEQGAGSPTETSTARWVPKHEAGSGPFSASRISPRMASWVRIRRQC